MNARPSVGEFNPYYDRYIALVPDGDIVETFRAQFPETLSILNGISESHAGFRYAEGKWSIKELLGHVIDAERLFIYRALCIARGDTQSLPGFEEDDYVRALAYIMAGHERHHRKVLQDRYLEGRDS